VKPPRHFQLARGRLGHAALVDRQADHRGVVAPGQVEDALGLGRSRFQVGGIEQAAPRRGLQRHFHHFWLGGVEHQRHAHHRRQRLDHFAHQVAFVGAFGQRHAHVQAVRAAVHLLPGDLQNSIHVFGHHHLLELGAALRVQPLADQERRRHLLHGRGLHRGCQPRIAQHRARRGRLAVDALY